MNKFKKKFQPPRAQTKRHLSRDASLTGSLLLSPFLTIVAAVMLNFCVRDGYRCLHHAVTTGLRRTILQNRIRFRTPLVKSSAY